MILDWWIQLRIYQHRTTLNFNIYRLIVCEHILVNDW
jgi:hypothetical protein